MISQLTAWLMTPLQRASAGISYAVSDAAAGLFSGRRLAQENEYAVGDRKAMEAGGGKYLNFIAIVLRKK